MKNFNKFMEKACGILASLALIIGISSVDSACFLFVHQPKVPEAMNKFKKIQ